MLFRFAIDERSFNLAGMPASNVATTVRSLVDLVEEVIQAGHGVCFDPDMFSQPIWNALTFWELFSGGGTGLSVPDMERAATQFSTLVRWDDTDTVLPTNLDVTVAGGAVETSGTIAWAHAQSAKGLQAAACISCAERRALGKRDVTVVGGASEELWFVDDAPLVREYLRDLLALHASSPFDLQSMAGEAFPSLDFTAGAFGGIKSMSRGLPQIAPDLVRHLAALSDAGGEIFAAPWQHAGARFRALGVSMSDENGNTKQNSQARKERTLVVDGVPRVFWWHAKLEPDRDRIHFDPERVPAGGRILVGIFCRHLTT